MFLFHVLCMKMSIEGINSVKRPLFKSGDSPKGGSTGAVQDPEEHAGGGLNMMFIIIPVAALIALTAIIVIAIVVCRR